MYITMRTDKDLDTLDWVEACGIRTCDVLYGSVAVVDPIQRSVQFECIARDDLGRMRLDDKMRVMREKRIAPNYAPPQDYRLLVDW